jgi:hypothetical protein
VGENEDLHRQRKELMQRPQVKALYERRRELVEPVFGIVKDQHSGRRFLLRGLTNARAEWSLLATGFNLRSLFRAWAAPLLGSYGPWALHAA